MDNINWIFFGVFISEKSKKLNMDALHRAGVTIPEGQMTAKQKLIKISEKLFEYMRNF